MSALYKAFFRYDTRWWIPIDAIEYKRRGSGIPDYHSIDSPGDLDLQLTFEEARQRQHLGIRVSKATIYSIIGREALDGLNLRHQYKQSFGMWFVVEKHSNGRISDSVSISDPQASQWTAPSVYSTGWYWGMVIDLKLPSAVLGRDTPKK